LVQFWGSISNVLELNVAAAAAAAAAKSDDPSLTIDL